MIRLLLVRHGQSEWNAQGRWQGQADPPLTGFGRLQASDAASRLPEHRMVVASSLQRAHQTAQGIIAVTGTGPVHIEPLLMERSAGGFSGLTREEIEVVYPGYLDAGRWPEGWESDDDLVERVRIGLAAVVEMVDPDEVVVVITHGGCIYAIEAWLGADFERISNLGARWIEVDDGGGLALGPRMHLLDPEEETTPDQL